MGNILNGINLSGLTRCYGGTFLVFSDYMRASTRLAALSKIPTTFVWTHDSVGVGEDGPTHQPVEHVMSLRLMPDLDVVRPADANETAHAWPDPRTTDRPAALVLSRQNLTIFDRSEGSGFAPASLTSKGAYTLIDASDGDPQVILWAPARSRDVAAAKLERRAFAPGGVDALRGVVRRAGRGTRTRCCRSARLS